MTEADREDRRGEDADVPEPPVVDVRDWPPMSRTDAARAELDREVGTLGVGAGQNAEGPEEEQPEAWAPGTPEGDEELGTGVMGRGEDLLTKGETHALGADPALPADDESGRTRDPADRPTGR